MTLASTPPLSLRLVHYSNKLDVEALDTPETWPEERIGIIEQVIPPPSLRLTNRRVVCLATIPEIDEDNEGPENVVVTIDGVNQPEPTLHQPQIIVIRQNRNGYCCWKVIIPAISIGGGALLIGVAFIPSTPAMVAIPELLSGLALTVLGFLGGFLFFNRRNL